MHDAAVVRDLAKYVTLTQAARSSGLSTTTLRGFFDEGKVRGLRDPLGRRLILAEDLEKLIRDRARESDGRR